MPVPLDDLRRRRSELEAETFARDPFDLGVDRRVLTDGARQLADAHLLECTRDPSAGAVELERPDGELQSERRRLRVDPVGSADAERLLVLLRAREHGTQRALDAFEQ